MAGAAALLRTRLAGQQAPPQGQAFPQARRGGNQGHPESLPGIDTRSNVALIHGDNRRKAMHDALVAIDKEVQAKMKGKKSVLIKPNFVNTQNQLAASHIDGVRGILDYLSERFKGPIVIGESSAGDTEQAFENFKYKALPGEYKQLSLVDFNRDGKFVRTALLDGDLHVVPVRLAQRLFDPETFVISSCMLKTHNTVVLSLGIKNMALGAPLHYAPGDSSRWNDKRKYHVGLRQTHYNMLLTLQKLASNLGVSVIDGYEGMEGNGPASGTPVPSRVAIASMDFVAGDRVACEAMSVDPEWLGYAKYAGGMGLGQYDLAKIDVIGAKVADVKKPYRMHPDIEKELKWQGPMTELPFNLGWVRGIGDHQFA
jgi:uncharacterized protein (DUF362 family)